MTFLINRGIRSSSPLPTSLWGRSIELFKDFTKQTRASSGLSSARQWRVELRWRDDAPLGQARGGNEFSGHGSAIGPSLYIGRSSRSGAPAPRSSKPRDCQDVHCPCLCTYIVRYCMVFRSAASSVKRDGIRVSTHH